MAEQDAPDQADPQPKKPDLMRDWVSLWQSELAAMASDREAQEGWQRMARFWTQAMGQPQDGGPSFGAMPNGAAYDGNASAGAAASAWAKAASHAFGGRDAELERMAARIAELERRIAELERRS